MTYKATAPPMVWNHESLLSTRKELEDSILVTIDLEGVDHLMKKAGQFALTSYDKLSEVGIATYDPREKVSTFTSNDMEALGSCIHAHHTIVHQFRRVTEETCPAYYHKKFANDPKKQHHARPYHCAFVKSIIKPTQQALEDVKILIQVLSSQNLTKSEIQSGKDRRICIFYWAANMEESVFAQAGIDLTTAGTHVTIYDMQIWSIFQIRFQKGQTGGEEAFKSLGALGNGLNMHNATNDCVTQLLSLMKILSMSNTEWNSWFHQLIDLAPMAMSWVNLDIYQENFNIRPRALHGNAHTRNGQGGRQHRQNISVQATGKPSGNDQTASAPIGTSSQSTKNAAPFSKNDEVSQFWAKIDKAKVASTMKKYGKPATNVSKDDENFLGWPANMPDW